MEIIQTSVVVRGGRLRVDIPLDAPEGEAVVVVVVRNPAQPDVERQLNAAREWRRRHKLPEISIEQIKAMESEGRP